MKLTIALVAGLASLAALVIASVVLPFLEAWGVGHGIVQRGQGR